MLDSPEGVCEGQVGFEYPATSVLFKRDGEHLFWVAGTVRTRSVLTPTGLASTPG
jgi:hypothetical protein